MSGNIEQLRDNLNKIKGRQQYAKEQLDKAMQTLQDRFGINTIEEAIAKAQDVISQIDQEEAKRDEALDKARGLISKMLSEVE